MQELITRITEKTGISTEQANNVISTVKDFVKEKFPMMAGAVDNLFASAAGDSTAIVDPTAPVVDEPGFLDKISDFIPGQTGEKVESFAKGAADKAEDAFGAVKEKLTGMFGDKK
jgi:hypothetical protein